MKEDDDNFNFEDDFEHSSDESPPEATEESSELLPHDEFSEEELDAELTEKPAKAPSRFMDFLKTNILFIALGVAGVGIAGYMIYGILFPNAPQKAAPAQAQPSGFGLKPVVPEPVKPAANSKQTTTGTKTPATTSATVNPMPAVTAPVPSMQNITMTQQDMKILMEGFAKVVSQNSQNIYSQMQNLQVLVQDVGQASLAEQKQTQKVANALNNMQQNMQTLATDLAAYNKNMIIVGQELDKTQQQLSLLLAEQTASVQKLTLRAVVPGRAWLVDDQGNTTTVTVGTELPSYGKVVDIDSGKGEVIMSTGFVFK